jgi:hypothetical protein
VNAVLRHYVDELNFRPQSFLRFFIVPLGSNLLAKYLCSIDSKYAIMFGDEWKELLDAETGDANQAAARVSEYLVSATTALLLPIAEAMVTYRYDIQMVQLIFTYIHYDLLYTIIGFNRTVLLTYVYRHLFEMPLGVGFRKNLKQLFAYF